MSLEQHAMDLLATIVESFDINDIAENLKGATQLYF
jgi:hypothetical protein